MIKPHTGSFAVRGAATIKRKRTATTLALSLSMILMAQSGAAFAACTPGPNVTCSDTTANTAIIGGGDAAAGNNWNITVNPGSTVTNTSNGISGNTVFSVHDNSTITVNGTVSGNASVGYGGMYNTGPNVIEANTGNTITIGSGAIVQQLGSTTNGEAVNVHGHSNTIINNGTISSHNGAALWFQDRTTASDPSERNHVINHGTIRTDKGPSYNVFGSSQNSGGPGLIFDNYGTVDGSLRFGNGSDSLTFGSGSVITGNVDGGGGTNDLTLYADSSDPAGQLLGSVKNFTSITKEGDGTWGIFGQVPSQEGEYWPSSPITGTLANVTTLTVNDGTLNIIGAAPDFHGTVQINANGNLSVQADSINYTSSVTNNGTLTFDQPAVGNHTYSGQGISGNGMVIKQGDGDLIMNSATANTYSGGTWIRENAIVVDRDSDLGAATGQLILGTDSTDGNLNGTLKFGSSFDLSASRDITILDGGGTFDTNGFNTTVNQAINGTGDLTKAGDGVLTLASTANTYDGDTIVEGGTLAIAADGSLGSNANGYVVMYDDTTLQFNGAVTSDRTLDIVGGPTSSATVNTNNTDGTWNGQIQGGQLIKAGAGTLTLTNTSNSYQGGTVVKGGTLAITDDDVLGAASSSLELQNNTTLQLNNDITMNSRPVYLSGGEATIDTLGNTGQLNGVVSGSGKLIIDDSTASNTSVVALYGNNSYSGGTQVKSGTVAIQGPSAFGIGTDVELWNQTTLRLDEAATISNQNLIIGNTGKITGPPNQVTINTNGHDGTINSAITEAALGTGLVKNGGGILALYGNNTYSGGTNLNQGTIAIKADSGLGATNAGLTMADGTTLRLDDDVTSASRPITLTSGQGTIDTQDNTGTLGGVIGGAGKLVKDGTGTLILTNNNTYAGGTVISQGALQIGNGGTTGSIQGDVVDNGALIFNRSDVISFSGVISGTGSVVQAGIGTTQLTGTNTYSGGTNINNGILQIATVDNLGTGGLSFGTANTGGTLLTTSSTDLTAAGNVVLNMGGGTIDTVNNTVSMTQTISGPGRLTKTGTGILTLTGNNGYTGGTQVQQGTLAINSNNALGADSGGLTLDNGTTLQLDADVASASRPITLTGGTATIDTLGNTGTFGGNIGGAGGLDKTGSGTLNLLGNSGYQGETRIMEGTLGINSDASLGAAGSTLELWNQTSLRMWGNTVMASRPVVIGDTTLDNTTIPNSVTVDTNGYNLQINTNITEAGNVDPGGVRLDKTGNGVLALYGQNEHQGGTWVQQGTVAVNSNSSLGSGPNSYLYLGNGSGTDSGTLRFDSDLGGQFFTTQVVLNQSGGIVNTRANTVIFGNDTLVDGSSNLGAAPYWQGSGVGSLTKIGSGVMGIDGFQYYSGATYINEGTLRIYSYDHLNTAGNYLAPIGAVNTTHVEIAAGARLEGQGVIGNMLNGSFSSVPGTTVDSSRLDTTSPTTTFVNSGTIAPGLDQYIWDAAKPTIPVTQFNSLTLAGNYTANDGAKVEISTQLLDDTSQHGTLVIQGTVDANSAVTGVDVIHQGGSGALTDQGIEIIRIVGTPDYVGQGQKFELISDFQTSDGRAAVVAGAYAYWMEADQDLINPLGSSGIFLRNAKKRSGTNIINPGTPLYESYALTLANLNRMPTLEQRVGHRNWLNRDTSPVVNDAYPVSEGERFIENRAVWVRLEGGTGTYKPNLASDERGEQSKYDLDYGRINFGIDWPLYISDGGSKLIGGLNLNAGQGEAEVKSPNGEGTLKTRNQGVGASLTWYSDGGFYADAQARYNWFSTDIRSDTIKTNRTLANSNDGRGKAFSLEVGHIFGLNDNWSLTPQAQLTYSLTNFSSFIDPQRTVVIHEDDYKSLEGRLGLALNFENSYVSDSGQVSRNKFYGLANYYHEFKGDSTVNISTVKYKSEVNDNWVGLAVGGSHNWCGDQYSIYGELGAKSSTEHFGSEREFSGELGFRLAF